jgi:hypothetical protein
MRNDDTAGEAFAWSTLAIVLVVLIIALAIAYFSWWGPRQTVVVAPQQPPATAPAPPGPSGPPGPPGPPGKPPPAAERSGAGPSQQSDKSGSDQGESSRE